MRGIRKPAAAWLACLALIGCGPAAAAYPERPIRIIVPYAPGAAGDIAIRQIQPELEKRMGHPLVIDYRSGAGGNIGTQEAVRALPDGYTLVLGATNNFVINQFLFRRLGFDPLTDLLPIAKLAEVPPVIWISAPTPAASFQDFARYTRSHPGQLNYGSPGAGTTPHLSAYMLSEALHARMTHVPYRGSAPGIQALLANEIQVYLGGYSIAAPFLATGKIRALAVASPERLTAMPDVPTTAEAGAPGVVLGNWWALAAPKGTDPSIVSFVAAQVRAVLQLPEVRRRYAALGFVPGRGTPAELAAELKDEARRWEGIVRQSGATQDN